MPTFSHTYLLGAARGLLEGAGTPGRIAEPVAACLVGADLAGHPSHGIMRLPEYLDQIDGGAIAVAEEPRVVRETAATAVIDARRGWGHYAVAEAMSLAIRKAKETGMGSAALIRINHAGRMGHYVEMAAGAGCVGLVFAGVGGRDVGCAAPFGGRGRFLGSNPIAVGVPCGERGPFVLDFATTVVARGKVKVARETGAALPPGCLLDPRGRPSTRPEDFFDGGSILPFGGHKGYALSLATCLVGALSGVYHPERASIGGVFVAAIDVAAFQEPRVYQGHAGEFLACIKSASGAEGGRGVLIPGEPERRAREARLEAGIEVPPGVWRGIADAAGRRGLPLPTPDQVPSS